MSEPIIMTLVITLKPGRVDEIYAAFPAMAEETRQFRGFRNLTIRRHADDPCKAIFIEEWESLADCQAYLDWRSTNNMSNSIRTEFAEPPILTIWPVRIV